MCQRCQNPEAVREKNGWRKFSGRLMSKMRLMPRATSMVPEKSQYNCRV